LLADPARRAAFGAAAHARAQKRFTPDGLADAVLRLYDDALRNRLAHG
jgi:hypothetical protein